MYDILSIFGIVILFFVPSCVCFISNGFCREDVDIESDSIYSLDTVIGEGDIDDDLSTCSTIYYYC